MLWLPRVCHTRLAPAHPDLPHRSPPRSLAPPLESASLANLRFRSGSRTGTKSRSVCRDGPPLVPDRRSRGWPLSHTGSDPFAGFTQAVLVGSVQIDGLVEDRLGWEAGHDPSTRTFAPRASRCSAASRPGRWSGTCARSSAAGGTAWEDGHEVADAPGQNRRRTQAWTWSSIARTNLCTTRTRPRRDLSVTWPSQGTFPGLTRALGGLR